MERHIAQNGRAVKVCVKYARPNFADCLHVLNGPRCPQREAYRGFNHTCPSHVPDMLQWQRCLSFSGPISLPCLQTLQSDLALTPVIIVHEKYGQR